MYKDNSKLRDIIEDSADEGHPTGLDAAWSQLPVSLMYAGRNAKRCAPSAAKQAVPKPKYAGLRSLDFASGKKAGV